WALSSTTSSGPASKVSPLSGDGETCGGGNGMGADPSPSATRLDTPVNALQPTSAAYAHARRERITRVRLTRIQSYDNSSPDESSDADMSPPESTDETSPVSASLEMSVAESSVHDSHCCDCESAASSAVGS